MGKFLFGVLTLAAVCTVAGCSAAPAAPAASTPVAASPAADTGDRDACYGFDVAMLHAVQVRQSALLGQYWSTVAEADRAEAGAQGASEQAVDTLSTRMHATAADMAAVSAKLKSSGPDAPVPDLSAEMRPVSSDARVVAALCTGYGVRLTNQP